MKEKFEKKNKNTFLYTLLFSKEKKKNKEWKKKENKNRWKEDEEE